MVSGVGALVVDPTVSASRSALEWILDKDKFPYRSSSYITQFFEECDLDFVHDGSTRWAWTAERLAELLSEPQEAPNTLPARFVHVLRVLMQKADAADNDPDRLSALAELNKPLSREGFEAFYGDDNLLYVRHIGTQTLSIVISPHRPFTPDEMRKREELLRFLDSCSEDNLIEEVLLPLFRQLGFQRISPAGHIAEHNQLLMMLGHESSIQTAKSARHAFSGRY